jgi:hypothetical protein
VPHEYAIAQRRSLILIKSAGPDKRMMRHLMRGPVRA